MGLSTLRCLAARRSLLVAAVCAPLALAACSPARQPAALQTVAAIETPMRTPADRADLVAILRRRAAEVPGLHVDDVTGRWQDFERQTRTVQPAATEALLPRMIAAAVSRGPNDDELQVDVTDGEGHPGRAWVTFLRGSRPQDSRRLRAGIVADIRRRWPEARDIPVAPTGALPLAQDLVPTGRGYAIQPDRVATYAAKPEGGS